MDYVSQQVSIHAPVKGATILSVCVRLFRIVSIHAPVKGATNEAENFNKQVEGFNSRTRKGCDDTEAASVLRSELFQFTHP